VHELVLKLPQSLEQYLRCLPWESFKKQSKSTIGEQMVNENQGDTKADYPPELIGILVENHRQFRAFLAPRVANDDDAEDILQSAFLKSLEKADTIRRDESVVAWFYRLLRNAVVDYYRHRDVRSRAKDEIRADLPDFTEPDPEVEKAICQCMYTLLPTLHEDYATILRRIDLEDASIADVARQGGMTQNNARVRLHRARQSLRKKLILSCGTCSEHGCIDCSCKK
jgi:RNA polymerase sigma-70 factor (ECF subfamily)